MESEDTQVLSFLRENYISLYEKKHFKGGFSMNKTINYYEEMGIDYDNSGVMTLVHCMEFAERFIKKFINLSITK